MLGRGGCPLWKSQWATYSFWCLLYTVRVTRRSSNRVADGVTTCSTYVHIRPACNGKYRCTARTAVACACSGLYSLVWAIQAPLKKPGHNMILSSILLMHSNFAKGGLHN